MTVWENVVDATAPGGRRIVAHGSRTAAAKVNVGSHLAVHADNAARDLNHPAPVTVGTMCIVGTDFQIYTDAWNVVQLHPAHH